MRCSYYALHSVGAYHPNQLTWHNAWLQFQAGMHVRWRWCIRRIWACTVRWLRWPFDGAFGVSYRKWTYTCVNMPSINRILTKVSMLYHLLTRYLCSSSPPFSLFSDFWVTLTMCRCASWVIATVNSYSLQSWQEHNMKIMEMLLCCTVVCCIRSYWVFVKKLIFQSGFLEEVNLICHDTVLWL